MQRNMKNFIGEIIEAKTKNAMPILSFPAIQLLNISVLDLISDSTLQANAMKAVADRTPFSAGSVSLMDLSVEAECFGSVIKKSPNEVPTVIGNIIKDNVDAEALEIPKVGSYRTGIYINAIEKALELINDRPVFAGIIGPFSLAGRLCDVSEIMILCYEEPDMVHTVLDKVTTFLIEYCKAYKAAGANGVVMAEPLAGLLDAAFCDEFSSTYVKRIVDAVQDDNFIVIYHNCGNATIKSIDNILSVGASAYHFGNAINMAEMMPHIPSNVVAMGNIDPVSQFCNGTPDTMKKAVFDLLEKCSVYQNFLISSGCDIPPKSKWENIDAFFDAINEFYKNK